MHDNRAFHFPRKLRESRSAQREGGVETFLLAAHGWVPNNARLPVVVYRRALAPGAHDLARAFNERFEANGWPVQWLDGVFDYHHFHSTAHEVLGVFAGTASVRLGGEHGITRKINAGDVVILPAGVAHKNLGASSDFGVVGAYPAGQEWDMNYGQADELPIAKQNIARVALPSGDPVYGPGGPLLERWTRG